MMDTGLVQLFLQMQLPAVRQQDEQDRRWRNMAYHVEQLKARDQAPGTGDGGIHPFNPLPTATKLIYCQSAMHQPAGSLRMNLRCTPLPLNLHTAA